MSQETREPGRAEADSAVRDAALIASLVEANRPVGRIAPLGARLAMVFAAWVGVGALVAVAEPGLAIFASRIVSEWSYGLIVAGLLACGVAGSVAALASAEPGREGLERVARAVCAGGLVFAIGIGLVAAVATLGAEVRPHSGDARCFGVALMVGVTAGLPLFVLLRRGFVQRPLRATCLGLLGAVGLGGLTVQLVCPQLDLDHALFGHVLPPALAMLAAAMPLALWLGADEPVDSID